MMLSYEEKYENKVFVVDNQRISVTQRRSVMDAIELAQNGYCLLYTSFVIGQSGADVCRSQNSGIIYNRVRETVAY